MARVSAWTNHLDPLGPPGPNERNVPMNLMSKYEDTTKHQKSLNDLIKELMDMQKVIDYGDQPINERRAMMPAAKRLAEEIRRRRKETMGWFTLTIATTDGSSLEINITGVASPR
jgi:hypothetical protein